MITCDEDVFSFGLIEAAKFRHYSLVALMIVSKYMS